MPRHLTWNDNPVNYVEYDGHGVCLDDECTRVQPTPTPLPVGTSTGSSSGSESGGFTTYADGGGPRLKDDIPKGPCIYQGGWDVCGGADEGDPWGIELFFGPGWRIRSASSWVKNAIAARFGKAAAERGLATEAGQAVFWSAIRGGDQAAAKWAASHGGGTLESTLAKQGISLPAWDPKNPVTVAIWRAASKQFAEGASGTVRVLQDSSVRVNSVWAQVEYPALKANQNVTTIISVNPRTGASRVLWSR